MSSEEITRRSSKSVYENRWMRVREDEIVRSDGSQGIYGVVEKADFVAVLAIRERQLFLVEQYRYPVAKRYWELPQGAWEANSNVDPLTLAAAELREETGLVAREMMYVGHLFLAYGYSTQGYHVFLATGLDERGNDLDPEEAGLIARPFPLSEVERMICEGEIKDATTVAALGLARMKGLLA